MDFATPPATHERTTLFDGTGLDNWTKADGSPADWDLDEGAMTVNPGGPEQEGANNILSRQTHTDVVLHVEFRTPYMPEATGQWRGNSGVFLQGRYEIQVLDSHGIDPPRSNDCGAVYKMHAPLLNACAPPTEWQTYDCYFRAPRFDADGHITEHARLTLLHNGALVHNNVEMPKPTGNKIQPGVEPDVSQPGPILLQCHGPGDPVSFRNIWIEHLPMNPPAANPSA